MILAVPAVRPVTIPEDEPTERILVLPLLHVPPGIRSLNTVVAPRQILVLPLIAEGNGLTVTFLEAVQPVGNV
jgi:hypothetical protein